MSEFDLVFRGRAGDRPGPAQRPLAGVVPSTWLRGRRVTGQEPLGRLISRGEA